MRAQNNGYFPCSVNWASPLNDKKTAGPSTTLEYLGIILDSEKMEARLPAEKLVRIKQFLRTVSGQKSCSKHELLSLLGHLSFACRVIYHGRTFMAHLIEASTTVKELHHRIFLSSECKEDIYMWTNLLEEWNGISMFHDGYYVSSVELTLFTDSCSSVGFGAYYRATNEALYDTWDNHPIPGLTHAMSYLELYPIVVKRTSVGKALDEKAN